MSQILIVDDEESICWGLGQMAREEGHRVRTASSAEEAFEIAQQERPDLVVLDVRLPGIDGIEAMSRLKEQLVDVPFVVITAFGSLDTAVRAIQTGAFDYLVKPFDLEQAGRVFRRALAHSPGTRASNAPPGSTSEELLGAGPAMQEVFKRIALVAPTESSVLVTGESGTGKELVARAIHRHSLQAGGPLVPVNLASLSPSLVESELFGHVRGAFTGAEATRQGLVELASGGTLMFDEVGDIPLGVQVKLLRTLEQREVTPVGDTRPRSVSFRVVAATNRDLREEVRRGRFREDLFFRLAVFEIRLPALRERVEDIPLLAEHFLLRMQRVSPHGRSFSQAAFEELVRRRWPGNVRQLRNAVEHAALVCRGPEICPEHFPPEMSPSEVPVDTESALGTAVRRWTEQKLAENARESDLYAKFLQATEPSLFETVLKSRSYQRAACAQVLGIHRATLRKKLS